ncbi:MAG: hypothetical protein ACRD68_01475 [Pyrinomonadaceae bacterium]
MKLVDTIKEGLRSPEEAAPSQAAPRPKWGLTKDAFDKLLARLDPDPDEAAEKYLLARRNLVRFFECRGCPLAEEHADEALNRLARRLDEGEDVHNVNGYLYGVARLVLREVFAEREREQRALREMPLQAAGPDPAEMDEGERRLDCLKCCLAKLPDEGRELIVGYYGGERRSRIENRQRLAEGLGISPQALRSRAVRLRERLEGCVSGCLRKGGRRLLHPDRRGLGGLIHVRELEPERIDSREPYEQLRA